MQYLLKFVRHQHYKNPATLFGFTWRYIFLSVYTNITLKGPLVYFGIVPLEAPHHIPHINFLTVSVQLCFYFYTLILPFQIKTKRVIFCYTSKGTPVLRLRYILPLYFMHFLGTYIWVCVI